MQNPQAQNLQDQVAIVTGGGTGIGRGVALSLAGHGVKVVVCGRRIEKIEAAVEAIWHQGGGALAVQADVADESQVDSLLAATLEAYGTVDILVNNAGVGGSGPIHQHDLETWDRVMAINLRGPFLLARAVLPILRDKRRGHIINISSEAGLEYYANNGAYGVSKHALNALGEYIQRENQDFGVRVDTICPGMVVTEMSENSVGLDHEKCLFPEDIAELVVWLVSRRPNIKIGRPILIQTMENPWG